MSAAADLHDGGLADELVTLALTGAGWQALLARLSAAGGAEVRLIGVHGACLAAVPDPGAAGLDPDDVARIDRVHPSSIRCLDGWKATAVAVSAGPRVFGILAIGGRKKASTDALLSAARLAIAIEAVRRDAGAQARADSAARLIDEVRFGVLRDPSEVTRIAERFGLRLDHPHTAVAFHYDGANQRTWQAALSWVEYPIRHDGHTGWTILADDRAELTRIRTRLQGMVGGDASVIAVSGSVVDRAVDTQRSFADAEVTLAVLRRTKGDSPLLNGPSAELSFDDLGTLGLLFSVPPERLRHFLDVKLGPILDRPELVDTLAEWYRANGSRAAVAERLHIHRNSVGYRLAKVGELLHTDLTDTASTIDLRTALAGRDALCVLDELDQQMRGEPVHPKASPGQANSIQEGE